MRLNESHRIRNRIISRMLVRRSYRARGLEVLPIFCSPQTAASPEMRHAVFLQMLLLRQLGYPPCLPTVQLPTRNCQLGHPHPLPAEKCIQTLRGGMTSISPPPEKRTPRFIFRCLGVSIFIYGKPHRNMLFETPATMCTITEFPRNVHI